MIGYQRADSEGIVWTSATRRRARVVFPDPELPTRAVKAPRFISKLNPLITMLPELERGKKYFANQGAGSVGEWANNTFNPFDYLLKANRTREKGGTAAALLSQINTRKLPTDRQLASIKADTRQYKDTNAQLNKILESQGYQISTSQKKTGTTYKLIDRIHGRVLGEFKTPAAAQKAADRIMGRG